MQDLQAPASAGKSFVLRAIKALRVLPRAVMPRDHKLVYLLLAGYADADGVCWPAQDTLEHDADMGHTRLGEVLRDLAKGGWAPRSRELDGGKVWAHTVYRLRLEGQSLGARSPRALAGAAASSARRKSGASSAPRTQVPPGGTDVSRAADERDPPGGSVDVRRADTNRPEEKVPSEQTRREQINPDGALTRTHAGYQQGESGDGGGGQQGPSLADISDPPSGATAATPGEAHASAHRGRSISERQISDVPTRQGPAEREGFDRPRPALDVCPAPPHGGPGVLGGSGNLPASGGVSAADLSGTDLPRPNPSPRAAVGDGGAWPSAAGPAGELAQRLGPEREAEVLGSAGRVEPAAPSPPATNPTGPLQRLQDVPPAGVTPALPGLGVELAPVVKAPRQKRRAEVDLPPGWGPKPDHFALGASLGLDRGRVTFEAAKFQDFHGAKGSRFVDWEAAFRTWLRNASTFGAQRGGPPPAPLPPPRPPIIQEAHLRGPPLGAANKPPSIVRAAAAMAQRRAEGGPPPDPERALAELCDILAPARKQRAS